MLIAGSLTTNTYFNPTLTEIELDAEYMVPINYNIHYMDIKKANAGDAKFEWLHDYLKEYKMDDLRPSNLHKLSLKVSSDPYYSGLLIWNQARRIDPFVQSLE